MVWEDDIELFRSDGSPMPTLELSSRINQKQYTKFSQFVSRPPRFIPCEKELRFFPDIRWLQLKERMFIERLSEKATRIQQVLQQQQNDWEGTLFALIARNFGLNINGDSFFQTAQSIPFRVIQKVRQNAQDLEALFLGQSRLLSPTSSCMYEKKLWERFRYLQHKFSLEEPPSFQFNFSRLGPANFPTIRWVQLAQLYNRLPHLFATLVGSEKIGVDGLRQIGVSDFWKTHYSFLKESSKRKKRLSPWFIELLLINTLLPFYFCYQKAMGKDPSEEVIDRIRSLPAEKNAFTRGFQSIAVGVEDALDSQALIQLKQQYCEQKKCLLCPAGLYFLKL